MFVDSSAVALKVRVDREGSGDRTVGHDLSLDLGDAGADVVRCGKHVLLSVIPNGKLGGGLFVTRGRA